MHRFLSFSLFFIFLLSMSCGGGNDQQGTDKSAEKKSARVKKYDVKTEAGMMAFLDAIKIKLPEDAVFDKVERNGNGYKVTFQINNVLPEGLEQYNTWLKNQIAALVTDGWRKMVMQDNEKISMGYVSQYLMYPPKNIDPSADRVITYGITISTTYIENNTAGKAVNQYSIIISED